MKANKFLVIVIFGSLFMGPFSARGQQTNNPHKFDPQNWEYSEQCNPCHVYTGNTPNAKNMYAIAYEADSLNIADSIYLSGISKICVTCHDGTVATFGHDNNASPAMADAGTTNSHPVSVAYEVGDTIRNKLYNPNITMSGLGSTITDDMLKNGRVECTSCHDVHFSTEKTACKSCPPPSAADIPDAKYASLLKTNKKSTLCLTCHKL